MPESREKVKGKASRVLGTTSIETNSGFGSGTGELQIDCCCGFSIHRQYVFLLHRFTSISTAPNRHRKRGRKSKRNDLRVPRVHFSRKLVSLSTIDRFIDRVHHRGPERCKVNTEVDNGVKTVKKSISF